MAIPNVKGTVINERMGAGIPGTCSRVEESNLQPGLLTEVVKYGRPVVYDKDNNGYKNVTGTSTAADIAGWPIRPYPAQGAFSAQDEFYNASSLANTVNDILVWGYVSVELKGSASVKLGDPVYIAIKDDTTSQTYAIGDVLGAEVQSATITLDGALFMGPADANGFTEIRVSRK